MLPPSESFSLTTDRLMLDASMVPWDSVIYSFPIASITHIKVIAPEAAGIDYACFNDWLKAHQCQMVSCRLAHDCLRESIFLEEFGFRFIEMVLHPVMDNLDSLVIKDQGLDVLPASEADLGNVLAIAETAFTNERFFLDPRLPPECSHQRYSRWTRNALSHEKQRLLKIVDGETTVAFFVVEEEAHQLAYWHLTAVSPKYHGKGYGYRAWLSVLKYHQENGIKQIRTTIAARNTNVLNLYSKLNFRFQPPEMTFHWVRK